MQLKEIVKREITSIKKFIELSPEQEESLEMHLKNMFYSGGIFLGKLISKGSLFCSHCEKEYSDEANIEAIDNLGMCTHCEHVLGESLRG